jgi:hypothetical protein
VSLRAEASWFRTHAFATFLAVASIANAGSTACARDTVTHIDIGKNEIGAPPAGFNLLRRSEDKQGRWVVVRDATAVAGLAIEQSGVDSTEDRFPLAIAKTAPLKNAEISLRLKANGGRSDRDGGIAVRLKTPDDYYLVRLDALRDRVLLSRVTNGVPEEIVGVDADISSHTWHSLAVRAKDEEFVVSLDGAWVFTGYDKTLSQPGRIALWTKGDSIIQFDSIAIAPLSAPEETH